jgi:hypothetical protein
MLTITIGYDRRNGGNPKVLYCGNDAGAGTEALLSPPPGTVRTQIFKAPAAVRTRYFEVPAEPCEAPAPPPEEPPAKAPRFKPVLQKNLLPSGDGSGE